MTDRDLFETMCTYYISLMDGDTHFIGEAYALMKREGIVDEEGERIYPEDEEDIQEKLSDYLEEGYEGQILRDPQGRYEGKRSKHLLKHKEFEDAEFQIVSVIEGKGNWAGYAKSIEIRLSDGTTQQSGVRGSFDKLQEVLYNADDYIGTEVTVRYQNKTVDGKLRFPVVVAFWKGKRNL